jgi:2-polyprenyl-6-methoxyphenol hydroxylase-like FAD-dependent oxidoreductase
VVLGQTIGDMHLDAPGQHVHDVVVVGARCAGAATGMLLARMGHDVVVVDRTTFPSDTLSTHAISRSGVVQLHRWGLLEPLLDSGAPAIREVSFHIGDDVITKRIKDRAGVDLLVAPRRYVLDALLVDAADDAGADVRTGITVSDVCRDGGGRATGIVGTDVDGRPVHIRARFVVGADGLRSGVARSVGAGMVDERHRNGSVRYTYVAGLGATGTEFHLGDRLFAGVFPTHDGEANVWVCGPTDRLSTAGEGDRDLHFLELVRAVSPRLHERVLAGRRTAPVRGFHGMPNQLRQAAGPGWALVGDAGYFRDAVTGHGMSDAFRDAETLAGALEGALRGDEDDDAALARYARTRDRDAAEIFDLTCQLSSYPSRERFTALQKQLSAAIEAEAQMLAHRPPAPRAAAVAAA